MSDRIRKAIEKYDMHWQKIAEAWGDNEHHMQKHLREAQLDMLAAFVGDMEEVRERQTAKLHLANKDTVPSEDWYYGVLISYGGLHRSTRNCFRR